MKIKRTNAISTKVPPRERPGHAVSLPATNVLCTTAGVYSEPHYEMKRLRAPGTRRGLNSYGESIYLLGGKPGVFRVRGLSFAYRATGGSLLTLAQALLERRTAQLETRLRRRWKAPANARIPEPKVAKVAGSGTVVIVHVPGAELNATPFPITASSPPVKLPIESSVVRPKMPHATIVPEELVCICIVE